MSAGGAEAPIFPARLLLLGLLALAPSVGAAVPPPLYHSPADDGASGGAPAVVPAGQPVTLHLYLGVGPSASTASPCHQGDGDELCGYLVHLAGSGMVLQSFTPADPDVVSNLSATELRLTGGDFQTGQLGPTKLGDLVIEGPTPGGTLELLRGDTVSAALALEQAAVPTPIVELPEPGLLVPLTLGAALIAALRPRRRMS